MLPPSDVSGYVLAGGRSSRMGRDKALLQLAGKPLVHHAVDKLRRVCAEVSVLGADQALAPYGPLVPDLHPGCGPLSGMEAALTHARHPWSLILPVDVPFLPASLLDAWVRETLRHGASDGVRLAMHTVDGRPQPTLLMLHRDLAGYLTDALQHGRYKVMPVLDAAAASLALESGRSVRSVFRQRLWHTDHQPSEEVHGDPSPPLQANARLYFTNLNTPADFAEAEKNVNALDLY